MPSQDQSSLGNHRVRMGSFYLIELNDRLVLARSMTFQLFSYVFGITTMFLAVLVFFKMPLASLWWHTMAILVVGLLFLATGIGLLMLATERVVITKDRFMYCRYFFKRSFQLNEPLNLRIRSNVETRREEFNETYTELVVELLLVTPREERCVFSFREKAEKGDQLMLLAEQVKSVILTRLQQPQHK
jgi:hypothetical protein